MITQLKNEEKDYIDRILSNGLDEIKDIPSFELSTISNEVNLNQNNNHLSYLNSSIHNNLKKSNNVYQLNFDYNLKNMELENSSLNNSNNTKKMQFNEINNKENNKDIKNETKNIITQKTQTLNIDNMNYVDKNKVIIVIENENEKDKRESKNKMFSDDKNDIDNNINDTRNNYSLINKNTYIINKEKNLNLFPNYYNEEKNKILFNNININCNKDFLINKEKENNSNRNTFLMIPSDIPNNKEIIENALLNNQKNLNKIGRQISGDNFAYSLNDKNNKNEIDLSKSTRQLIEKYIDLQASNNYNKKSTNINNKSINILNQELVKNQDKNDNIKTNKKDLLLKENKTISDSNVNLLEKSSKNSLIENDNIGENNISNNSRILIKDDLSESNNNDIDNSKYKKNEYYEIIKNKKINDQDLGNKSLTNNLIKQKNSNKKYKPKSSALKKLIDKLKKEENLYNNNEEEELFYKNDKFHMNQTSKINNYTLNTNSIQISQINDSELFTLGNSSFTISAEKNKKLDKNKKGGDIINQKNKKRINKNNSIEINKYQTNVFPHNSKEKYNKLKNEMDSIQDQIKNIFKRIDIGINTKKKNIIKKTYSAKSIISNSKKTKFYPLSSVSSLDLENVSPNKTKKERPYSVNNRNIDNSKKNQKYNYKKKYKELKEKFELQKEKMKSEKQNIISLRQKIKIIDKKYEKYSELVEYNKTLNEQNKILIYNLNNSDEIRKKQSLLIKALQNEINLINNKIDENKGTKENEINKFYKEKQDGTKFDLNKEDKKNINN